MSEVAAVEFEVEELTWRIQRLQNEKKIAEAKLDCLKAMQRMKEMEIEVHCGA